MNEVFETGMKKIKIGLEKGSNFSRVVSSVVRQEEITELLKCKFIRIQYEKSFK